MDGRLLLSEASLRKLSSLALIVSGSKETLCALKVLSVVNCRPPHALTRFVESSFPAAALAGTWFGY